MLVDHQGRPLAPQRDTNLAEVQRIFARELGARGGSHRAFSGNVWIYSIVTSIAAAIGDIPFGLWRPAAGTQAGRFSSKTWVPVTDIPLEERLKRPNPWQDWRRFIEQWTTFLLLGGNVWMYVDEPTSADIPRSFLLFGTDSVLPVRQHPQMPPSAWQIQRPNDAPIVVPLNRMIHWALPNDYDQWMGMPPWMSMDIQLDADRARVIFDRAFFRNNATPDLVLTHKPGPISRSSRELIEEAWYNSYGGEDKHGGVAVVGGDIDVKVLGIGHAQAEYISSRKFTRQEAAACYAYPVQLLNDIEGGGLGRDQLSVARTMKYENAVFPHANRFAEKFTEEYIRPYVATQGGLIASFNFDPLPVMIDFLATKTKILGELVLTGIPINAALAVLDMGLDPVEGGNYPYIPSTLQPLRPTPPEPTPVALPAAPEEKLPAPAPKSKPPAKKAMLESWEAIDPLTYRAIKSAKRVYIDAQREAFKHLADEIPFNVVLSAERWKHRIEPYLMGAFMAGAEHAEGRTAWTKEVDNLDDIVTYLQYSTAQYPEAASCVQELNDESADVLRDVYTRWSAMTGKARERVIQSDIANQAAFGVVTDAIMRAMIGAYNRGVAWAQPAGTAPTILKITYHQAEATP